MNACPIGSMVLVLFLAGCAGPDSVSTLETDVKVTKERIADAREERKSHGKGSVVHDLLTLRIAIDEQTLAMLEQLRAAGKAQATLSYAVDAKRWAPPADVQEQIAALEKRIEDARKGRESDLAQAKVAAESVKSLYVMSAATKSILISQLEYQLAGHRHGFPPYYVPFHPPAPGTTPPQIIEVPAGKSAIVQ